MGLFIVVLLDMVFDPTQEKYMIALTARHRFGLEFQFAENPQHIQDAACLQGLFIASA